MNVKYRNFDKEKSSCARIFYAVEADAVVAGAVVVVDPLAHDEGGGVGDFPLLVCAGLLVFFIVTGTCTVYS